MSRNKRIKVTCKYDGTFVGYIADEETYDKVKNGVVDWKEHVKPSITEYKIPAAVFKRLLELDRQLNSLSAEALAEIISQEFSDDIEYKAADVRYIIGHTLKKLLGRQGETDDNQN